MADDLVSRFTATLDELERVATFGGSAPWRRYMEGADDGWAIESTDAEVSFMVGDGDVAAHIERWDPQAVLRLVAAARKLTAAHKAIPEDPNRDPDGSKVCSECLEAAPCRTVIMLGAGFGVTEED